jgi:hypothetical protein
MPDRQEKVTPGGAIGQSATTLHVGTQRMPIGVVAQVQPREPAGHRPAQPAVEVQAAGPIAPASATTPASPPGIIMAPALNEASGAAWKHRGIYGQVLVST